MEDLKTYMHQGVVTLSHDWRIAEKVGSAPTTLVTGDDILV
jgi:hypothetical protein